MKISNQDLVADLINRTQENIRAAELLKTKTEETLNKKETSKSWSALECIEHLNRYSDFYLPEIN